MLSRISKFLNLEKSSEKTTQAQKPVVVHPRAIIGAAGSPFAVFAPNLPIGAPKADVQEVASIKRLSPKQ